MRALLQGTTDHCSSLHNCPGSHRTIRLDSHLLRILSSSRPQIPHPQTAWVPALQSRHHSSNDNLPACKRGSPRILQRRPNLGNTDSNRCTVAALAKVRMLASAAVWAMAPAWAAAGTYQSGQRKRSGRTPIRWDCSASTTWVCSSHHQDNPRAARLERPLACPVDTPHPATAC